MCPGQCAPVSVPRILVDDTRSTVCPVSWLNRGTLFVCTILHSFTAFQRPGHTETLYGAAHPGRSAQFLIRRKRMNKNRALSYLWWRPLRCLTARGGSAKCWRDSNYLKNGSALARIFLPWVIFFALLAVRGLYPRTASNADLDLSAVSIREQRNADSLSALRCCRSSESLLVLGVLHICPGVRYLARNKRADCLFAISNS